MSPRWKVGSSARAENESAGTSVCCGSRSRQKSTGPCSSARPGERHQRTLAARPYAVSVMERCVLTACPMEVVPFLQAVVPLDHAGLGVDVRPGVLGSVPWSSPGWRSTASVAAAHLPPASASGTLRSSGLLGDLDCYLRITTRVAKSPAPVWARTRYTPAPAVRPKSSRPSQVKSISGDAAFVANARTCLPATS